MSILVEKGFTQVEENDYNESFSPMVKHYFLTMLIPIVKQYNLDLKKMEVKKSLTQRS